MKRRAYEKGRESQGREENSHTGARRATADGRAPQLRGLNSRRQFRLARGLLRHRASGSLREFRAGLQWSESLYTRPFPGNVEVQ